MKTQLIKLTVQLFVFVLALTFGVILYKFTTNKFVKKDNMQAKTATINAENSTEPISKMEMEHAWSAAYGYTYCYPKNFEYINEEDIKDEVLNNAFDMSKSKFVSKDGRAKLLFWSFNTTDNVTYESERIKKEAKLRNYFKQLLAKNNEYLKDATIIGYNVAFSERWNIYFIMSGNKGTKTFIWKTELSELPVSGDLIFKSMLFEYETSDEKFYEPIAEEMTEVFGMNF